MSVPTHSIHSKLPSFLTSSSFQGAVGADWEQDSSVHIVGNLPFSVSTVLLLKWIKQMPSKEGAFRFGRCPLTLLFQKEIAYRLHASPGTKDYGRLSVMSQNCSNVVKRFDIKGLLVLLLSNEGVFG
jgi:dimethyladenosine transferase 1, mitochondrial